MKKLVCLFILFTYVSAFAQIYSYRSFNEDAGLVQSFVYDIKQDKKGFLYIGTGNGLSVFSGYGFSNYTTENGLKENFVTTMLLDSKQRMWLGHFEGGVSVISDNGTIIKLPAQEGNNYKVMQVIEIQRGKYLILKNGFGISIYDEASNKFSFTDNTLFNDVLKVLVNKTDLLFLKSDGVYSSGINDILTKTKPALNKILSLTDGADMEISPDKQKFVTVDNKTGVCILSNTSSFNKLDAYPIKKAESTSYTKTLIDKNGNIYIGTTDMGMYKIEPESGMITNFTMANGLKSNAVQSIFVDREQNLWIGLYGKGLQQMNSELFNYNLICDDNRQPVSINKLLKLNNKLYAATNAGIGIVSANAVNYINGASTLKTNYNNLVLFNNKLYFSSEKGALFESDTLLRAVKKIDYGISNEVVLINNIVAGKKNLYICTSGGLAVFSAETFEKTIFTTQTGLLHNNVKTVFEDLKHNLWICSPGSPLHYMNTEGAIKIIDQVNGLKNFSINSICQDSKENYWISTIGDGIIKYNPKESRSYTIKEGLKSNYCYGVVIDRRNNVWVNHINGISYKVASKTNFNRIDADANLTAMNFIENSYFYDKPNGKLYFGAAEGFVTINTRKQKFNEVPAQINLTEIRLNTIPVNVKTDSVFSYNAYDLSVSFMGICLTDPLKIKYKYILEGYDKDWQQLTFETRKINYSQIKDGDYTLKIMVANNDDLWNETPLTYKFSITRPFWKQAWFYIIALVVLGIIFYLAVKWYTRRLLDKQQKLEEIITIKTNEITFEKTRIEDLFKELKIKNTDLTDSINYARRIQEALLPLDSYISSVFNTAYFYKAKDIVSGDFYWFKKTKNFSFAAAVDCTGHGVPGAFMSFIGATILDEIVNNNENLNPVEILKLLDERVIKVLNQHSKEGDSNFDGMDLCICKFDSRSGNLEVSGAGRPFYLYSNESISRIKSSRYSAGGAFQNIDKGFELYSHKVSPGENLFLYSDGFTDQMGGPRSKKYSSKRLRNFLIDISPLDAAQQKLRMEKEFEDWRNNEEQTDDVLIISIKF